MRDKWINGVIAGVVAGLIVGLVGQALESLGLVQASFASAISRLLIPGAGQGTSLLGWIGHLAIAGIIGTAFVLLIDWTDDSYLYIKGIFTGLASWALTLIVDGLSPQVIVDSIASSWLWYLGLHLLFGLTLAITNQYLQQKRVTSV